MSVDPSAIIVGVAAAIGGFVHGADLPEPAQGIATQQVQSIVEAAPALGAQIDESIAGLPPEAQDPARRAVDAAAVAVQDAVAPLLPPVPDQAPPQNPLPPREPQPQDNASPQPSEPVATEPYSPSLGPSQTTGDALAKGASDGALPRLVPSVLDSPAATSSAIGSIAVFVPWFQKAGAICDGVKAPVLAALYAAENGFRYGATAPVSPSGARGPGQFMPATWAAYGKDADGDGKADILDVADSVMASGHLLCDTYNQIEQWKSQGEVVGDTLDLTIAGYNAGVGAVRSHHGMPSGEADYENQTKPYVAKIRASESRYASLLGVFGGGADGIGGKIVEAAIRYLGLPYVWGGGNVNGPSAGGFDCSGLTSYAVHAATSGLSLPRTSEMQWNVGVEVPLADAMPGDLLFGNWGPAGPGHVAIYVGNGQMVHAPTTGDVVRIAPVFEGMKARRVF
ncbi:C40 family peptidase [Rhodococcus pseudokoreensis]|uniref:C40 family peptidase n=1 Tax=Rhodococcus pseudokoreensis TaxID=2811421 RepID=A0A974ZWN8_9NOCA|nr:bifunctional lytic transglycosylase/C40 family peptidase [Rhodococcus pseudokoreensis]QSE92712.1 C40 family peptidase [Rhodococcus pseudokoreensis]